jgi:hypothetical protein
MDTYSDRYVLRDASLVEEVKSRMCIQLAVVSFLIVEEEVLLGNRLTLHVLYMSVKELKPA